MAHRREPDGTERGHHRARAWLVGVAALVAFLLAAWAAYLALR